MPQIDAGLIRDAVRAQRDLAVRLFDQLRQDAATHLKEFRELRDLERLCAEGNEQFAGNAVETFLTCFHEHGEYLTNAITLLAEISTLEDAALGALRAAFDAMMKDADFLREAASLNFDVAPVRGEAMQKIVADVLANSVSASGLLVSARTRPSISP